mmetsp:Transcript_25710/g.70702  ORF Transcript_25710/g.70702 Transcript_25710/m.70702 type:complete len:256 (-) Transcript_25710:1010-1777(-)
MALAVRPESPEPVRATSTTACLGRLFRKAARLLPSEEVKACMLADVTSPETGSMAATFMSNLLNVTSSPASQIWGVPPPRTLAVPGTRSWSTVPVSKEYSWGWPTLLTTPASWWASKVAVQHFSKNLSVPDPLWSWKRCNTWPRLGQMTGSPSRWNMLEAVAISAVNDSSQLVSASVGVMHWKENLPPLKANWCKALLLPQSTLWDVSELSELAEPLVLCELAAPVHFTLAHCTAKLTFPVVPPPWCCMNQPFIK